MLPTFGFGCDAARIQSSETNIVFWKSSAVSRCHSGIAEAQKKLQARIKITRTRLTPAQTRAAQNNSGGRSRTRNGAPPCRSYPHSLQPREDSGCLAHLFLAENTTCPADLMQLIAQKMISPEIGCRICEKIPGAWERTRHLISFDVCYPHALHRMHYYE